MASVVLVDAEVRVDEAVGRDNTHGDDNSDDDNSDARYDTHARGVAVDEVHRADVAVRADAVVVVRMHTCLLAGKIMRVCIVSYHRWCKSHTSLIISY
jgi:hypothetical protein